MAKVKDASGTAAPLIPKSLTLSNLRAAAAKCRACPLWKTGTQTVFGEGSRHARVLFVGEQPGDHEDLEGNRVPAKSRPAVRGWMPKSKFSSRR